ncbi:MAG: DUF5320 domain-containing protein [Bacillota bacterium]
MPGFSGTGPRGKGPLTGRGRGCCIKFLGEVGDGDPMGARGRQHDILQDCPRWQGFRPARTRGEIFTTGRGGRAAMEIL